MLTDHHREIPGAAREALRRRTQIEQYGDYLRGIAKWCWLATITLSRRRSSASALAAIKRYLGDLAHAASSRIGWVVAESYGRQSNRLHFHMLIAGVDNLPIQLWQREAARRFGESEFAQYDSSLGGAFYIAENALTNDGDFQIGGELFEHEPEGQEEGSISDEARSHTNQQNERSAEPELPPEEPPFRVFVAGSGNSDGVDSAYAWLQESSGKKRVRVMPGLTKSAVEFRGLYSALQNLPDGATAEVLSDSRLCSSAKFSAAFPDAKSLERFFRLQDVIRIHQLKVKFTRISPQQNIARNLL